LIEKYGDSLEILPIDIKGKSEWIIPWSSLRGTKQSIVDTNKNITQHSTLNTSHFLRAWSHIHHTGGFFVCVMRKKSSTLKPLQTHITTKKLTTINSTQKSKWTKTRVITTPYNYNRQIENIVKKMLEESFGIILDLKRYSIISGKHKLNLTDVSVKELVVWSVWFQECGIPILKPTGKTFSLEHQIAIALWHLATKNTIELSTDELQRYCLWEDIPYTIIRTKESIQDLTICNGYYILTHQWLWVAVGKVIDNTIKNKFFKW
jgi:NOL1/NOP2/fmu family ribosome biogenesis protein